MKWINKFLLITLLGIWACGAKLETVEIQNEAGIVTGRYTQNPETKLREGKSFSYYENGQMLEEADYKNGQLQGVRKMYYENGQLQAIERYENGQFAGLFQAFYNNGALELEGEYTQGEMNGEWKRYYDSGELMEKVLFVKNEENGPFIEFYKNGNTKAKGTYKNGDNEHGELELFDESGELERRMDCDMGRCQTTWQKEGKKM